MLQHQNPQMYTQSQFQNDWVAINADWLHPHHFWMNQYYASAGKPLYFFPSTSPTMDVLFDDMNLTIIGLYFVGMMFPLAFVVSAIVAQHAVEWFNNKMVPYILSKRPHRPTVTIPYQYQYDLNIHDYAPTEFRKVLADAEESASVEAAATVSSSATAPSYPSREYDHTYVCDLTPDGLVFMRFSPKHDAFVYYSSRTIIYNYLNALARKYVINTNNPAVFINPVIEEDTVEKEQITNSGNDNNKETNISDSDSESDNETEKATSSVFVRAKPIAGSTRAVGGSTAGGNGNKPREVAKFVPANKFIHLGTIADMKLGQHQRLEKKTRPMTFADFKSMFFGRTNTSVSV